MTQEETKVFNDLMDILCKKYNLRPVFPYRGSAYVEFYKGNSPLVLGGMNPKDYTLLHNIGQIYDILKEEDR